MQAIVLESYGGPEVLTLSEVPDPVPGPDEVRVEVVATALNRAADKRGISAPITFRIAPAANQRARRVFAVADAAFAAGALAAVRTGLALVTRIGGAFADRIAAD